ncbi:hypothetical protein PHAVU_010G106500 [Phaseolus vulgaris]|uniref:Uncharacterized protein n=1 Tax=Phaseolus vulgaris TaxID=3885 RepID=V7ANC2_PHAVU|nr:hypothetical protein PHAVU_010G106500g [Phaseolus vulgaris]ESW07157.1 hypothetical protein PHAVU_010G106500g [Phaseolus vulgaris]
MRYLLRRGLLDEKTEESQVEKHDEVKPKEVLLAQEGECNEDEETSSSTDNTSKATQLEQQQQPLEEVQSSGESDGWLTRANRVRGYQCHTKGRGTRRKDCSEETQEDGEGIVGETLDEEKTEPFATSAALEEVPVADDDEGLNGESKLVEENEKLRKMMKKLVEAGNEQLNVISDLIGRVKELEKRLARSRSKRVKTKRCKPATSKMSSMKPLNSM